MDTQLALTRVARLLRSGRYTVAELKDGSGVLVNLDGMNVLSFNRTGMFLVGAMGRGLESLDDLSKALSEGFDVDQLTARCDTTAFAERLLTAMGPNGVRDR